MMTVAQQREEKKTAAGSRWYIVHAYTNFERKVADAIRDMVVRGAPAIGIAAAYGVVLAARAAYAGHGAGWRDAIVADLDHLAAARPTAVNLAWAVQRMAGCLAGL